MNADNQLLQAAKALADKLPTGPALDSYYARDELLYFRQAIAYAAKVDTELAINKLASELPEEYEVQLSIELGAAWVDVIDTDGDKYSIQLDDATMGDRLLEALNRAKEMAK